MKGWYEANAGSCLHRSPRERWVGKQERLQRSAKHDLHVVPPAAVMLLFLRCRRSERLVRSECRLLPASLSHTTNSWWPATQERATLACPTMPCSRRAKLSHSQGLRQGFLKGRTRKLPLAGSSPRCLSSLCASSSKSP